MANEAAIEDVSIGGDGIRLGQFMKFASLLDSGGDVKEAIIDGFVTVNGEVDRRRGQRDVVSRPPSRRACDPNPPAGHSHSMVPGGLDVTS